MEKHILYVNMSPQNEAHKNVEIKSKQGNNSIAFILAK